MSQSHVSIPYKQRIKYEYQDMNLLFLFQSILQPYIWRHIHKFFHFTQTMWISNRIKIHYQFYITVLTHMPVVLSYALLNLWNTNSKIRTTETNPVRISMHNTNKGIIINSHHWQYELVLLSVLVEVSSCGQMELLQWYPLTEEKFPAHTWKQFWSSFDSNSHLFLPHGLSAIPELFQLWL